MGCIQRDQLTRRRSRGLATQATLARGKTRDPGTGQRSVSAHRSPIVGEQPMFGAIDGHGAAVREDPLRSGMAEWDSDADESLRVVTAHHLDDGITLFGAQSYSVLGRRSLAEVGDRRPGQEDGADRAEDAAFAERADNPADVARGEELLGGLEDEHTTLQDLRGERESPG